MPVGNKLQIIPLKNIYTEWLKMDDRKAKATAARTLKAYARNPKSPFHQFGKDMQTVIANLYDWTLCPNCGIVIQPGRRHVKCEDTMRRE